MKKYLGCFFIIILACLIVFIARKNNNNIAIYVLNIADRNIRSVEMNYGENSANIKNIKKDNMGVAEIAGLQAGSISIKVVFDDNSILTSDTGYVEIGYKVIVVVKDKAIKLFVELSRY